MAASRGGSGPEDDGVRYIAVVIRLDHEFGRLRPGEAKQIPDAIAGDLPQTEVRCSECVWAAVTWATYRPDFRLRVSASPRYSPT